MFCEYDNKTKNYKYKAKEVPAKEILLPPNAPLKYADRQTLWNAVEKAETQWNAQLARGIILALPNEIPREEYAPLVRDYCREQFVSRGMIADFAIHDKGDGNPHAHILLTMRAMDDEGRWLPKAKKVYDLDENGEKIRLPSGSYKSHKEPTTDWDRKENAELWRSKWAEAVNRYYERHGLSTRLDLRSYERQGKDELPSIHLGPAAAHMEEKGIRTQLGDYNRQIRAHNNALRNLKRLIADLSAWLKSIVQKLEDAKKKDEPQPTILDFIHAYDDLQKAGRLTWSVKGRQTAAVNDLKLAAKVSSWMQATGIRTLDDLQNAVSVHSEAFSRISENKKAIRRIDTTIRHIDTFTRLKPVYDQSKRGFDFAKRRYTEAHKEELAEFQKSVRYLKANKIRTDDRSKYVSQRRDLYSENNVLEDKLQAVNLDPDLIGKIRWRIDKILETGTVPQHKPSIKELLDQPKPLSKPNRTKRISKELE